MSRKMTLFGFTALFVAETLLAQGVELSIFQWIMLSLSASMIGRTVAYLGVFDWVRFLLVKEVPHSSGAGADNHPKYSSGPLAAIGELMCCPVCSGTWGGMALIVVFKYFPSWGNTLMTAFSVAALAWFASFATQLVEWKTNEARENTGNLNYLNKVQRNGHIEQIHRH
jgi:hypothetical protein